MVVSCQKARLRGEKSFYETDGVSLTIAGDGGQPARPDAIPEATIGQLQFDVSKNAEGIRRLDEQTAHLKQYVHNERANLRELIDG
jgi:hypothetical protein